MGKWADKLAWIFVAALGFGCLYSLFATWCIFTLGASGIVVFPVAFMYFCTMGYVINRLSDRTP
jgi:ABC-type enterochelin transport system permease subunit